ncbi:MAG: hypothetical protein IJO93_03730 [Clostridia bacterium]|nr:hypothetical protein [Clostridia bacterium]
MKGNQGATPTAASTAKKQGSETFTFSALPESLEQMCALPEAALDTPFQAAALTVCALCAYAAEKEIGISMLNFLRGPRPLSGVDISFLDDRFRDKKTYVPFSYFEGAVPQNDYTPNVPFKITVSTNPYSYDNDSYCKLYITSGGADAPRAVTLRQKGDGKWCLWEQFLLPDIRTPKSQDPWA